MQGLGELADAIRMLAQAFREGIEWDREKVAKLERIEQDRARREVEHIKAMDRQTEAQRDWMRRHG